MSGIGGVCFDFVLSAVKEEEHTSPCERGMEASGPLRNFRILFRNFPAIRLDIPRYAVRVRRSKMII